MTLNVLDANANKTPLSTTTDGNGGTVGSTCVTDPNTGAKQQVSNTSYASDAQTPTGNAALVSNMPLLWNGQTFDRARGNEDAQASVVTVNAAPASTINSANITNWNQRGAQIGVNVTQISASTTIQIAIQGLDVASGQWYTLLTSTAFGTTGFTLLTVYPGIAATANVAANAPLPRTFRIVATVAGSGTASATVGVSKIV